MVSQSVWKFRRVLRGLLVSATPDSPASGGSSASLAEVGERAQDQRPASTRVVRRTSARIDRVRLKNVSIAADSLRLTPGGQSGIPSRVHPQDGYAPDDETLTTRPFLLRNDGTWVLSYHFACLPKKEQWRFAFESMAEVVKILEEVGQQDIRAIWTLPDGISPEEALRRYKTALPKFAAAIRDGTPVAAPSPG